MVAQLGRIQPLYEARGDLLQAGHMRVLERFATSLRLLCVASAFTGGSLVLGVLSGVQPPMPAPSWIWLMLSTVSMLGFLLGGRRALPWALGMMRRRSVRRRLAEARPRRVSVSDLVSVPDGEPVIVTGWVRGPTQPARAAGDTDGSVFRRMEFSGLHAESDPMLQTCSLVCETGIDFVLADPRGGRVIVEVAYATLLPDGTGGGAIEGGAPQSLRGRLAKLAPVLAIRRHGCVGGMWAVFPGDEVSVFAYKDSRCDWENESLPRQTPLRPVLRGTDHLPLIVLEVRPAPR
ncbi:MAG: hypothetical protein KA712_23355 [Myxococcales bacterium]|nr:hypothetical protein [Myxococcales bacterium]